MRKLVFFVFIFFTLFFINPPQGVSEPQNNDYQVIPDDAIRLRILANSDHDDDQELKHLIRDEVSAEISDWVEDMTHIDDARELIEERIPYIQEIAEKVVEQEAEGYDVDVEYGKNVTFPRKLYGSYIYPEGEYEAVLITVGEGEGSNWWCVLFPPLCFLDFSFGTSVDEDDSAEEELLAKEEEEKEEKEEKPVTVRFFLFEWLGWT